MSIQFNPGLIIDGGVNIGPAPWKTYSYLFNGSTDYITASYVSGFAAGTGDFTVEGWVYLTSTPTLNAGFASINSDWQVSWYDITGGFTFMPDGSTRRASITGMATNTWYHMAFVKSSGSVYSYLDGTLQNSGATTTSYTSTNPIRIGTNRSPTNFFPGYISDFRYTRTALYTSNFPVPERPLVSVASTYVWTARDNQIIDDSGSGTSLTVTGSVSISDFQPTFPFPPR